MHLGVFRGAWAVCSCAADGQNALAAPRLGARFRHRKSIVVPDNRAPSATIDRNE